MIFKNTNSNTFLSLLCIFLYTIDSFESIQNDACRTKVIQKYPPHYFMIDRSFIKTKEFLTTVYSINKECTLDVQQLLEPYKFDNVTTEIGLINLVCANYSKVFFNLTEVKILSNIIAHFNGWNCSFERENALQFLETLNFRVLNIWGFYLDSFTIQKLNSPVLDKIVSLSVLWPKNDTIEVINYLFGHQNNHQNMADISISYSPAALNLSILKSKFPNLQKLDVRYSALEDLDNFPWTDNISYLPDGLWRSKYLQDYNFNLFYIEIPGNIIPRSLHLRHCNISDLTQIHLKGPLHVLDFTSNRIQIIRNDTFNLVFGLQSLVLMINMIDTISEGAFNTQQSIEYLDLSRNQMSNMSAKLFLPLKNLKYLYLAHNLITSLPDGIFFYLNNLKILRLDNNLLFSVSLSYSSKKLHTVYLNDNPLHNFPVSGLNIRSLKNLVLKNTKITFDNLTSILQRIDYHHLSQSAMKQGHTELRIIDLTGSKVKRLEIDLEFSRNLQRILALLLSRFYLILKDNPLTCDCNIVPFNALMQKYKRYGMVTGNEYFFKEWTCKHPRQFIGEQMLLLSSDDTYCDISDTLCPLECKCFKRYNRNVTIVDCFQSGLNEFPKQLPHGIVDLWINNNNISTMPWRDYFKYVHWLDASNNTVSEIQNSVFIRMSKLKTLNLDNNKLSYLPDSIKHLNLRSISLKYNRLRCDCHSLWTKHWLISIFNIVENVKTITCLEGQQKPMVSTPDKDFICLPDKDILDLLMLIPILAAVLVLIILILIICAYRFDIKVLLYIYCGLHPFDKLTGCKKEIIDFTIIYSKENEDFVQSNVVTCLQQRGYNLLDIHEHFLVGYSFQDNIASAIQLSKHVLVILSEQMLENSKLLNIVWSECQTKIEKCRTSFVILACHDLRRSKIQNKAVTRYLKRNRCLNTRSALFLDKLSYYLPKKVSNVQHNLNVFHSLLNESRCMDSTTLNEYDIFITYSDEDRDILSSTFNELENDGYKLCLPDLDFVPGAPIAHNIVDSINKSTHTVLVTRGFMYEEEIFAYRAANEKSAQCKYNHLIVIFLENDTNISLEDKDIEKYLGSYVTLRLFDPHFLARLKSSLLFSSVHNESEK